MYRIVRTKPTWLAKLNDGTALFEVRAQDIAINRAFPGIGTLQNCHTWEDVLDVSSDFGTVKRDFRRDSLEELLNELKFQATSNSWEDRRPDIQIWQTVNYWRATVYLDRIYEYEVDLGGHA
jgi:hypothetical protein